MNSLIVTAATIFFTLLLSSMVSYAIVYLKWKFSKAVYMIFLVGVMLSIHAVLLPLKYPKTKLTEDCREMSEKTAEIVKEILAQKTEALLCFPAGSTIVATCKILKKMQDSGEIDFSKAKFVALDEWIELGETEENCTHFLTKHLYGLLNIKPENMVLFQTDAQDLQKEC